MEKAVVPVDKQKLEELARAFAELPHIKQMFLLTRFPGCETDLEAIGLMDAKFEMTANKLGGWKRSDALFLHAYELMKSGIVDLEAHLARTIEQGNAILAAMENRKLILTPWSAIKDGRTAAAKSSACNQALDRIVGKRENVALIATKLADVVPKE